MYTERQAIRDEMHFQRDMILKCRDNNLELLKRLRELDERDMGDSVSYDGLKSLTEQQSEIVKQLAQLIPKVSVSDVLTHVSKDVNKEQVIPEEVEENKSSNIHLPLENKKVAPISREKAASTILQILEDKKNAKTKEIEQEFYNRTGKRYANFYDKLRDALEMFPDKLSKKKGGFYTYIG